MNVVARKDPDMQDTQEQLAQSTPPAPSPVADPTIDLGHGQRAPLSEILSMANPKCSYCVGGWQRYHEGPHERRRLCGCAVRRMRRKLQGETPAEPIGTVTKNPELERARQLAERERLQKHVAKLEQERVEAAAEYERRVAGHDADVSDAEAKVHTVDVVATVVDDGMSKAEAALSVALAEVERCRGIIARLHAKQASVAVAKARANAILADAKAKSAAIVASAEKVSHRAERLAARIAAIRAQHPELALDAGGAS